MGRLISVVLILVAIVIVVIGMAISPVVVILVSPQREVVFGHDCCGVFRVKKSSVGVCVSGVALFDGFLLLFAGDGGGAGHGLAVDDEADGEADGTSDEHAEPVNDLVARGHLVALFDEYG